MLVAALNPCPCGYRNDPRRDCHCTTYRRSNVTWQKSVGPLLDRIDIHIEVPSVPFKELAEDAAGTSSGDDAGPSDRVTHARRPSGLRIFVSGPMRK